MRPRAETLLISALINNGSMLSAENLGIRPEMFSQRQAEYRWCQDYQRVNGKAPSGEALEQKFPGCPYFPDKIDVPFHAEEVIYDHNHRRLARSIKDAAQSLAEGDMEEAILTIGSYNQAQMTKPLINSLDQEAFLDTYQDKIDILSYPWQTLDEVSGGMRKGELTYLAARLGQGKSWALAEIMAHNLMEGQNMVFYSLEMSEAQVLTRMHVVLGAKLGFDVDHIAMRNRVYDVIAYRKLVHMIREEVPGKLFIHDTSKGVVSPVTLQTSQAQDADLIVVDHVGLMHLPSGGRAIDDWRAMATISNQLKEIALSNDTRILAAAQINRDGDSASKWPPKVKHLAQSDALGQDADTVVTHKRWGKTVMCFSIEKNRDGASEVPFFTLFDPNNGDFHQIGRDEAEERREEDLD